MGNKTKKRDKKKEEGNQQNQKQDSNNNLPLPPNLGDEYGILSREIVKPDNQLELTDVELEEEIAKMLTANNPAAPQNIARFNAKEKCYKFEAMVFQCMIHYSTDGWLLHKSSEEARKQIENEKLQAEAMAKFQAELEKVNEKKGENVSSTEMVDDSKQLRNQFNFSDRAVETCNNAMRDKNSFTEPPPTDTKSGIITQSGIYDAYIKDLEKQKRREQLNKQKGSAKKNVNNNVQSMKITNDISKVDVMESEDMYKAMRIMERMINQNLYNEITMDFKYWDDAADYIKDNEGTLLPLWKFSNPLTKSKCVTAICWNSAYFDMFAVGYGSYNFSRQTKGIVCIYSLKNPSYPEIIIETELGVMSLDFHFEHKNLLAIGCYDGTVMVYNINNIKNNEQPMFRSGLDTGKHDEAVWAVSWQPSQHSDEPIFYSVSSDGRVGLWTLTKSAMLFEEVAKLKISNNIINGSSNIQKTNLYGGCSLHFNQEENFVYLIGTEEGDILWCSTSYSTEYLNVFNDHALQVYAVKWNDIEPHIFISASADWTVKIWDSTNSNRQPIATFNLNAPVGDVAWYPGSSTIFAAVTDDSKMYVFDVSQNKYQPMCEQKICKKGKLTRISFNSVHPIVLVGDENGNIHSLKLSPNLRKICNNNQDEKHKIDKYIEIAQKSSSISQEM